VQQTCRDTAEWLAQEIAGLAPFELVSNGDGIPAFAFRIGEAPFTVYEVSETLRGRGWLVPAYRMPPALDEVAVLRVVVRNGFSRDLAELLLDDLTRTVARLHANHPDPATKVGFHH
jgi:glutamate decarboxylase